MHIYLCVILYVCVCGTKCGCVHECVCHSCVLHQECLSVTSGANELSTYLQGLVNTMTFIAHKHLNFTSLNCFILPYVHKFSTVIPIMINMDYHDNYSYDL